MYVEEQPQVFNCRGSTLIGIVHRPKSPHTRGVLIVVGGPQYRVGSHRQFVLLARHLAEHGVPVFRFDYRGMGDAQGDFKGFESVEEDIGSAVEQFFRCIPELREIVIWGLCDAASAALFFAHRDPRVRGLVLVNPWVYTEQGAAQAYLKHYYLQRLVSRDFWRKVAGGRFEFRKAYRSFWDLLNRAKSKFEEPSVEPPTRAASIDKPLPERLKSGLEKFRHPVLLILSGRDLTADEFRDLLGRDRTWRRLIRSPRVTRRDLAEADHTFSSRSWRDQVAAWTLEWVRNL
jgi:exosortase A-associated hydrolase 1